MPFIATHGLDGYAAKGDNTDIQLGQLVHIPACTVDDHPFPAILYRIFGNHVADQGVAQAAAAINHQHLALAIRTKVLLDPAVVLETFHRHHFTTEGVATAIAEPVMAGYHRNTVGVVVTKITGHKGHTDS